MTLAAPERREGKLVLPDLLHARPANLFVRVASERVAEVRVRCGEKLANAKSILEVLALGAARGATIELEAEGPDAEQALDELTRLVLANFDADLVPETGAGAAPGIGIGAALLWEAPAHDDGPVDVAARFTEARAGLEALLTSLAPTERELLIPERAILAEVEPRIAARVAAGEAFAAAVEAETESVQTDLFLDVRMRLLGSGVVASSDAPSVLVVESLPPSLVASLPPSVVGIVSAIGEQEEAHGVGSTSHAAILARSRGIPLAYVDGSVTACIATGDRVVVDTLDSPARVWVAPGEKLLAEATARLRAFVDERARREAALAQLELPVALRVNVSRADEAWPPAARGVGLLRTELVFAGHAREPTVAEQTAAYRAVVDRASGHPVSVRVFDAGRDKPLPWLPVTSGADSGVELLFAHEAVLKAQLEAIFAAGAKALLPLVRSAADVERARSLAPPGLAIGAMIETEAAVARAAEIAAAADFVSIGSNDLTADVLGIARSSWEQGLAPRVREAIATIVQCARDAGKSLTVCGELAAHPEGARMLVAAGVSALSVPPSAVTDVAFALASPLPSKEAP